MSRGHSESRTGFRATFRPLLDDRGDAAGRISRKDLLRAARSENVAIQSIATRLKHAMKSEGRRMTPDRVAVTIAAVIGVFFATSLINALLLPSLGFGGAGIGLLVFVGMIALAHVVVQGYVRRGALNQLARTAVAEGVCGSCAFPLEGVPAGEDARVVCPECGAAWANERIVEPFWERPATGWLEGGFRACSPSNTCSRPTIAGGSCRRQTRGWSECRVRYAVRSRIWSGGGSVGRRGGWGSSGAGS